MNRRWIAIFAALAGIAPAAAQQYPTKPVRIIIPFAAGSTSDLVVRFIQPQMAATLGSPVVIDNRPGAAGNLGTEVAARAAPDGYTLLMGTIAQSVGMTLYPRPGYDLTKDFAPIILLASGSYMMVAHPSLGANNVKEFVALAKKRPGAINIATAGATIRLAAKLLDSMAGIKTTEITYKSSPQLMTAVMSGESAVGFAPTSVALPNVKTAKIRGIAVTSAKRAAIAPDIPTVAESLPGYNVAAWYGLLAPAGTSKEVIAHLHAAATAALAHREVKERFATTDLEPSGSTPEKFGALMSAEVARWGKLIKQTGMQPD